MRTIILSAVALGLMSSLAMAKPVDFTDRATQTSKAAPQGVLLLAKITKENKGGQTPKGNANGVPSKNPAGKEPPGQNKKSTGKP